MTTEATNKENKPADTENAGSTGDSSGCGPGCRCEEPTGKVTTKLKIVVCLVVAVAVCGIILFKTTRARQNISDKGIAGFSNPFATKGKVAVLNSAGQQGGSGAMLSAIAELNTTAAKLDTVFLVIPNMDNAPTSKETGSVLASVERILNTKGLSTGIYTLQANSPDYPDVAAKVTPPGIAVLTKGRSIGFVSGGISETTLMQAYVASTRGGGCGPGGCPPPADGKAAVPCN
jgi:hypothetical protein